MGQNRSASASFDSGRSVPDRDPRSKSGVHRVRASRQYQEGESAGEDRRVGKTIACAICHGDTLPGLGEVPRIAGMQPVYLARQLITIQNGTSAGTAVALMKKVVAHLSEEDIISISAYLGSLPPR